MMGRHGERDVEARGLPTVPCEVVTSLLLEQVSRIKSGTTRGKQASQEIHRAGLKRVYLSSRKRWNGTCSVITSTSACSVIVAMLASRCQTALARRWAGFQARKYDVCDYLCLFRMHKKRKCKIIALPWSAMCRFERAIICKTWSGPGWRW